MYFSLKDAEAQVRCAMFRGRNSRLAFVPKDGLQVLVKAQISLYEGRGDFQLIIEHMEEAGDGALRRAFEILKKKLEQEGLFSQEYKKPLPPFPRSIGVITSPTGAAIRDILNVLQRRAPHISIIIYPTSVQGADAAPQIVKALQTANQRQECDVLLLARGGGSLEDLWPFNAEIVARAIFASQIPVVSGVGHEIDFTIADFVADQRAPTPSAAAELVSPHCQEWLQKLAIYQRRLWQKINDELRHLKTIFSGLAKLLQHPQRRLQEQAQQLDYLESSLQQALLNLLHAKKSELTELLITIHQKNPEQRIMQLLLHQDNLRNRLDLAMQNSLKQKQQIFNNMVRALEAVSPLNTLQRGYAIVQRDETIIQNAAQVNVGDKISAKLGKGQLDCTVDKIL
jgi:exodeoxyribonuclease VII large subunit